MAGLCPPTAQELGAVLTPVTLPHLQAPRSRRLSQAPVLASSSGQAVSILSSPRPRLPLETASSCHSVLCPPVCSLSSDGHLAHL